MTKLTFNEYQERARATAVYPTELGEIYTTLGLFGEIGEIAQLVKRTLRDGETLNRERLADEIGDCLWYLAMYLFEAQARMPEASYYLSSDFTDDDLPHDVSSLMCWTVEMISSCEGTIEEEYAHESILAALNTLARHTPYTLEAIARRNLDKLADRANRGVLRGEGDER
jgi:NTP pyrophosphatase (non-canonical NTP hydrolase)